MDKLEIIKTTRAYQNIANDYHKDKLPHCNLLISSDKMSRELFSIAFANLVICDDKDEVVLQNITKKLHPDVYFLPKTAFLKVEDAELVIDRLHYFPMEADVKVFILENFSSATNQAQNKLLKTLEETPANVYFLICSEKEDGILPTIKSRCRTIELEPLDENILSLFMLEYDVDKKMVEIADFFGKGEMGRIDYALKNNIVSELIDLSFDIIENCKKSSDLLKFSVKLLKYKNDLLLFLQIYSEILEEILHMQVMNKKNDYKILKFNEVKNEFTSDALVDLIEHIFKLIEMQERSCNGTLIIDDILIETCKCANRLNENK